MNRNSTYPVQIEHISILGSLKTENQDSIAISELPKDKYILTVADGVSQDPAGGFVSRWLTNRILYFSPKCLRKNTLVYEFSELLKSLKPAFDESFQNNSSILHSTSTFSSVIIDDQLAYCFWAGDSPIYHLEPHKTTYRVNQVTTPDTLNGILTDGFGDNFPFKVKTKTVDLKKDDFIIVASDGINCARKDVKSIAKKSLGNTRALLEGLVSHAIAAPFRDDISIIVAKKV